MQLKLSQLVSSAEPLSRLSRLGLKPRIALRVKRVLRAVQPELDDYNKVRVELLEKHGYKATDGKQYLFEKPENEAAFMAELNDATSEEVTLEIKTLTLDELGDVEISGGDLLALDWLIFEEGD